MKSLIIGILLLIGLGASAQSDTIKIKRTGITLGQVNTILGDYVEKDSALVFNLSSSRNGDLLYYDSVNNRFVNLRPTFSAPLSWDYLTGTATLDTSTALIGIATKAYVLSQAGTGLSGTGLVSTIGSTVSYNTTSASLSSILSDETGTGALVFGTSPTFTTGITTPYVTGGTTSTSSLVIRSTSQIADATGANIYMVNGGDTTMTLTYSGAVGINVLTPASVLDVRGPATAALVNIQASTATSATSAGIVFQASRGSVGWDGTYQGLKLGTGDNGKPIVFGNSTTAGAGEYARFLGTGDLLLGVTAANSKLTVNGSFATAYRAITANRTLDATDCNISVTSGTVTVTLPTAVSVVGREYWVSNTGATSLDVTTTSSQTFINVTGTPTTISAIPQFTSYRFVSTGAVWLAYKITN